MMAWVCSSSTWQLGLDNHRNPGVEEQTRQHSKVPVLNKTIVHKSQDNTLATQEASSQVFCHIFALRGLRHIWYVASP